MHTTRSCPHCGKRIPRTAAKCSHCGELARNLDSTRQQIADAIHADALLDNVGQFRWSCSHPATVAGGDCVLCAARDGKVFTAEELEALMATRFCQRAYCCCSVRAVEL